MSSIDSDIIEKTISIARRSPQKRFLTGCVIVSGGKVISTGWSHVGHSLKNYFSVHAEIHALMRAPRDDLHRATAYLATVSRKSGNISTSSAPCKSCASAMFAAGIYKVVFTAASGIDEVVLNDETIEDLKIYYPWGNMCNVEAA